MMLATRGVSLGVVSVMSPTQYLVNLGIDPRFVFFFGSFSEVPAPDSEGSSSTRPSPDSLLMWSPESVVQLPVRCSLAMMT
jgi:hypothetical protein